MLKEKENIILKHLRKDARKSLSEISRLTKIPSSTVFDKINKLEKKVIQKYTCLIDFRKIGFGTKVCLAIKTGKKAKLKDFLLNNKNVNSLYSLNSKAKGFDIFTEVIFKNLKELYVFLEQLEPFNIKEIKKYHLIEDVKREGLLS